MNWRSISYPKLSGNVAETINALLSRDRPIEITIGEAGYSIRAFAVRERCATCLSLRVEVGGAHMDVHLSPATLDAILMDLLSRQAFEALDNDLQFTVLETALAEPLESLTQHLQTPATLIAITAIGETDPIAEDSGSSVQARCGLPHSLLFEIRRLTDASLFVMQADLNAGLPEPVRPILDDKTAWHRRDLSSLPVPVVLELGSAVLSASDLGRLEPGDIVLFDECYIDGDKLRINVGDGIIRHGETNGLDLAVVAPPVNEAPAR